MDPEIRFKCLELAQRKAGSGATAEQLIKEAAAMEKYCEEGVQPPEEKLA